MKVYRDLNSVITYIVWYCSAATAILIRRILFCLLIMFCSEERLVFQVFFGIYGATAILIVLVLNQPHENYSDHLMQVTTEVCLILFSYSVLTYTFFNEEASGRFMMGWIGLLIFFFNMTANICYIIASIVSGIKLKVR